jgi:hypothetical protein
MGTLWFIHSQKLSDKPSVGKIMAIVFSDTEGILLVDYTYHTRQQSLGIPTLLCFRI